MRSEQVLILSACTLLCAGAVLAASKYLTQAEEAPASPFHDQDSLFVASADTIPPELRDDAAIEGVNIEDAGSETVAVVANDRDYGVLVALDWQCGWLKEYVAATEVGSSERVEEAIDKVRSIADLDLIQRHRPEIGLRTLRVIVPELERGNLGYVRTLVDSCQK
ncbi:MAG: hypothetical protein Q4C87_10020 [Actinomycetaceae bacterium]|nr:hypothetical protein [Actinomycetaceae bacterium]